jgi:hypothetical protein
MTTAKILFYLYHKIDLKIFKKCIVLLWSYFKHRSVEIIVLYKKNSLTVWLVNIFNFFQQLFEKWSCGLKQWYLYSVVVDASILYTIAWKNI